MRRILVINSKGGSGKTTIATNLAGYYASRGYVTALFDYDPQGSSIQWLSQRPSDRNRIHGIPAFHKAGLGMTRAFQLRIPPDTERVILDAPAGVNGPQLADLVRRVDAIVVPVVPSPIDMHASSHFIRDLLLVGKVRAYQVQVGVVANRVRENTLGFQALQRFLHTLNIPFVTHLRDTQNYVKSAEVGLGIHELDAVLTQRDMDQWENLLEWLENKPERLP
jgi:chromosome partitioning protein